MLVLRVDEHGLEGRDGGGTAELAEDVGELVFEKRRGVGEAYERQRGPGRGHTGVIELLRAPRARLQLSRNSILGERVVGHKITTCSARGTQDRRYHILRPVADAHYSPSEMICTTSSLPTALSMNSARNLSWSGV